MPPPSPTAKRRDLAANAALIGIMSNKETVDQMRHRAESIGKTFPEQVAELAYHIADEMELLA